MVDMGTRLYDPATGRFTIRDVLTGEPKTPLSLNQYVYGADNPASMIDPDGMCYRDLDNQAGCGYTITTTGGHRYDDSFGKDPYGYICWTCAAKPLTSTHGFDAAPVPAPVPPKPTVMLSAKVIRDTNLKAARLDSINTDPVYKAKDSCHGFFGCIGHFVQKNAGRVGGLALDTAALALTVAGTAAFIAGTGGVGLLALGAVASFGGFLVSQTAHGSSDRDLKVGATTYFVGTAFSKRAPVISAAFDAFQVGYDVYDWVHDG